MSEAKSNISDIQFTDNAFDVGEVSANDSVYFQKAANAASYGARYTGNTGLEMAKGAVQMVGGPVLSIAEAPFWNGVGIVTHARSAFKGLFNMTSGLVRSPFRGLREAGRGIKKILPSTKRFLGSLVARKGIFSSIREGFRDVFTDRIAETFKPAAEGAAELAGAFGRTFIAPYVYGAYKSDKKLRRHTGLYGAWQNARNGFKRILGSFGQAKKITKPAPSNVVPIRRMPLAPVAEATKTAKSAPSNVVPIKKAPAAAAA